MRARYWIWAYIFTRLFITLNIIFVPFHQEEISHDFGISMPEFAEVAQGEKIGHANQMTSANERN